MALLNRLLALAFGLALLVVGSILAIETVVAALGRDPAIIDRQVVGEWLAQRSWTDVVMLTIMVGLIVVGAILLLLQLVPRSPSALPLQTAQNRGASIERKSLARRLEALAGEDPQVDDAQAKVRKRRVTLRTTALPGARAVEVRDRVQGRLQEAMDRVQLESKPKTRVRVHVPAGRR